MVLARLQGYPFQVEGRVTLRTHSGGELMKAPFFVVTAVFLLFGQQVSAKDNLKNRKVEAAVQEAHAAFVGDDRGSNADYIPALAEVPSELFGVTIVTVDGRVFEVGDVDVEFSIQSISKAFIAGLALQAHGTDVIEEKIGVNATGRAFNAIIAIEDTTSRTINPLVNAGAIATTSLIVGETSDERWDAILSGLSAMAGRDLSVLEDVYASETESNARNRSITWLLSSYDRMYNDEVETLDLYTRQCSIGVTTHDLAVMGATLANGGTNPMTGDKVVDPEKVPHLLSVMATAGLYETSGEWLWSVGLPAKSGVGGGIVAVAPGRFAVAAFSPPLDEAGNSVRAQEAIAYIAEALDAHVFGSRR